MQHEMARRHGDMMGYVRYLMARAKRQVAPLGKTI